MFATKQNSLLSSTDIDVTTKVTNSFIQVGLKESSKTTSLGNGALKYTTTGNDFVDQFGKITNYRTPREYREIDRDMRLLYSQNPSDAVKLAFYIRMITRTVVLPNGDKTTTTQRGQGLKHEGINRLLWLAINHSNVFWENLPLFISIGSWKDIIVMLNTDLEYHGWKGRKLNWEQFGKLILAGLENPVHSELIKKYLPQIRSNKQCTTLNSQADNITAKWICSLLFGNKTGYGTYKSYRKLKSSGTAHEWQQLISKGKHSLIDFKTIHGRALAQLVSGKYLSNHKLEDKYQKWIETQPISKYTGYVYELMQPVKSGYHNNNSLKKYQIDTINSQFMGLIDTAKKGMNDKSGLLVVVDTSSSMTGNVGGLKVSAYDVAKSMALYFSYLLKGPFSNAWVEFNDTAKLNKWIGNTPVKKLQNDRSEAYGSTNFQSVANIFAKIKSQGVSESEFPTGILCVSDGCFNSAGNNKTNTKEFLNKLRIAGFSNEYISNFKIILWDIPNGYYGKSQTAFEDFADCPNLFHMSGLDGSAVAFITGTEAKPQSTPKTSEELFHAAMDQEVLNLIKL